MMNVFNTGHIKINQALVCFAALTRNDCPPSDSRLERGQLGQVYKTMAIMLLLLLVSLLLVLTRLYIGLDQFAGLKLKSLAGVLVLWSWLRHSHGASVQ